MKRFIGLLVFGCLLASFTGFANETKPIPNTFSLTVLDDDCNVTTDFATVNAIEVMSIDYTCHSNANEFAVIAAMLVMDKVIVTYPTINEWLIYKDELNRAKLPENYLSNRIKPGWSATNSRK